MSRETAQPQTQFRLHLINYYPVQFFLDSSKNQLKEWMINNQVTGSLLRSVLPEKRGIADRSGAGGFGARSITAIVWPQKESPIIISIYIAQTDASMDERNQAIVTIGKTIFDSYIPN